MSINKIDLATHSVPLRTDISPSHHPSTVDVLTERLDPAVASATREALTAAYTAVGKLNDAEQALRDAGGPATRRQHPGGRTEYSDHVRFAARTGKPQVHADMEALVEAANHSFNLIAPSLDRRLAEVSRHIKALEGRIATAIDDPARRAAEGVAMAQEVRAHSKALPSSKERMSFVLGAIKSDDRSTDAAILHAPAFLSGLDATSLATLRDQAVKQFAAAEADQLAATNSARERIEGAMAMFMRRYSDVLQYQKSASARAIQAIAAVKGAGK